MKRTTKKQQRAAARKLRRASNETEPKAIAKYWLAAAERDKPAAKAGPPYEIWIGSHEYDLQPERVYTTASIDEVRLWLRCAAGDRNADDLNIIVMIAGKLVSVPPDLRDIQERLETHEEAIASWKLMQRDEFVVYDLRGSDHDLVDRQVELHEVISHLFSIWLASDPAGGYFIEERWARVDPLKPSRPKRRKTVRS
ncbi:hypothetical protein [Anatilimnocola floriformis]|uniref:hypothetical protein n=1 Tax=Anatilimnocola floriformis TaxID=2948575 RepID=UPI0020C2F6C3|nr:hypothetical protein [Anatilimnocola floriformis]